MPDDDKNHDDLKAKLKAAEDEIKELKAKLKSKNDHVDDDDDKDKSKNADDPDNDKDKMSHRVKTLESRAKRADERNAALHRDLQEERFGRRIDELERDGYSFADRDSILKRVVAAEDPDAELEFFAKQAKATGKPLRVLINTRDAVIPGGSSPELGTDDPNDPKRVEASDRAKARCQREGKPDLFRQYMTEELEKVK